MNKKISDSLAELLECCLLQHRSYRDCAAAVSELAEAGCRLLRKERGYTFIHAGFPTDRVCFLLEGEANVVCYNPRGVTIIQDAFCTPQMFGHLEVIDQVATYASSVVTGSDSALLEVPAKLFAQALAENLRVAHVVIRDLRSLAVRNMNQLECTRLNHPRDTIALYLYQCCEKNQLPYTLKVSRRTLSELLHIHLRSLYRYIDQLCELGLCENRGGKTVVTAEKYRKLQRHCLDLS